MNRSLVFFFLLLLSAAVTSSLAEPVVLSADRHFLGAPGVREWKDFDQEKPEAASLALTFQAKANTQPATLFIRQRDVKERWTVLLNRKQIGLLERYEVLLEIALPVPPGLLRDGENTLTILPQVPEDDIIIDRVRLDARPLEEALGEATLRLEGRDAESSGPLPGRFTVVDAQGALTPLLAAPGQALAVRTGVVYTGAGLAELRLPAGAYTVHFTRGFEYGLATQAVALAAGQARTVPLAIRREVSTPGLVACDTHIHTFTFSKHGDATLDERMLTLAGEGIELPIATDHNLYVDYEAAMERMKVQPYFTPIRGCEVTTRTGHFNVFPVAANAPSPPDFQLSDWTALMQTIRSIPGVQAVVLNHPRNNHNDFIPFAPKNFNSGSGDNLRGPAFAFDAIEIANSGTLQSDLSRSWRDWFALLNHGYRTVAVGSSDSHDVSRFVVGQGRTYIACDDHAPAKIDAAKAIENLKAGRALVSLGLLTTLTVDDKFTPGDTATGLAAEVKVKARVLGPAWSRATKVELYANGERVREAAIAQADAAGEKAVVEWTLPKPAHDAWLVAIATGPGIAEPYWNLPFPYQPQGRLRERGSFGLSNPIYLDADGDGQYSSPRALAQGIIARAGTSTEKLFPALADYDASVSTQAAALCELQGVEVQGAAFQEALRTAPEHVQRGVSEFVTPAL